MAAIADKENKLNLTELAEGLSNTLPAYARPLFLRILSEPPLTATFKLKKRELIEQGYNPGLHSDPIFFYDQKNRRYLPLTEKFYDDIVQGNIKL